MLNNYFEFFKNTLVLGIPSDNILSEIYENVTLIRSSRIYLKKTYENIRVLMQ